MSRKPDEFLNSVKQELDSSVHSLDGETRSKLAAARRKALEGHSSTSRNYWLPAGGFALAAMLILAVTLRQPEAPMLDESLPLALLESGSDMEIITALDDPELLEDLEFFYWLEEGNHNAS